MTPAALAGVALAVVAAAASTVVAVSVLRSSGPFSDGGGDEVLQASPTTISSASPTPTPLSETAAPVTTLAGVAHPPDREITDFADGPADQARFDGPTAIAVGADGTIFVADFNNRRIRKIDPNGVVSTLAGSGEEGVRDGPGASATFGGPSSIVLAPDGSLYVSDSPKHRIRRVLADGSVVTVAGGGPTGFTEGDFRDGPALEARFKQPAGLALLPDGTLIVADGGNHRIRAISPAGLVSTLVGDGTAELRDGPASQARTWYPVAVAAAPDGSLVFTEHGGNAVRRLSGGSVSTISSSVRPFYGDGTSTGALFGYPSGLAVASNGDIYLANTQRHEILLFTSSGAWSVIAGSGAAGYVDGSGKQARFRSPTGIAFRSGAELVVADNANSVIRLVDIR